MVVVYSISYKGKLYEIVKDYPCSVVEDYTTIMESFSDKETNGSNSKYLADMREATQYSLVTDGARTGFTYVLNYEGNGYIEARVLWLIDRKNRINSIVLLSWLLAIKPNTIRIYPHTRDISMWSSVATKLSLIRYHQTINNYLTVKLDKSRLRYLKLLGIKIGEVV